MKLYILVIACLMCSPVAIVMAAPPRFNGSSDHAADVPPALFPDIPLTSEPGTPDKATTSAAAARAGNDKPQTVTPTSNGNKSGNAAVAPPKRAKSWLWRVFHRNAVKQTQSYTQKQEGKLVDTDIRHKDVIDVSRIADVHLIAPGYGGRWQVQTSKSMCRLRQHLPNFGYVEFHQGVAQPLEFALYVDTPPAGSGIVRVSAQPPTWRHDVKARDLGRLKLEDGERAITATSDWSRRLIMELSEGMQPVLRFWDAANASDDLEIFLSAIRFQESLKNFYSCLGQLLHYDVKQLKRKVLHFNPDSSKVRRQTYQQLADVIDTVKADKGITEINLEIYTHREGLQRYNFRLASRRAQAVRDYLIKHGLAENKIFIKIYTKSKSQMAKLGYKDSDVYIALKRKKIK